MSYFNAMRCYELNAEMISMLMTCKDEKWCYVLNKADNPLYEILLINQIVEKAFLTQNLIEKEKLP